MLSSNERPAIRTELDSHADTCVVSNDTALITHDFDRPVRVHGYDDSVGQRDMCKTVTGVAAYDDPHTGDVYMLIIHQAILIPGMTAILLCPNQLRQNDIRVNDEPKHLVHDPEPFHHAISVPPNDDPLEGHDGLEKQ